MACTIHMKKVGAVPKRKESGYHVIRHFDEQYEKPQAEIGKKKMSSSTTPVPSEVSSQAAFIKSLQHKVDFLESEIVYLRSYGDQSQKGQQVQVPSDRDRGNRKLSDNQKETQNLKLELKRKQTTIDLLRSEKDGIIKRQIENEAAFGRQKGVYLEQVMELKKERDDYVESFVELERSLEENKQKVMHLEGNRDSLNVQLEELQKEIGEDKAMIENLLESKKDAQKLLHEANMRLEMKSVFDQQETVNFLKAEIQDLHSQLALSGRAADHEKILRTQLTEDNENLIKRSAVLEAEIAEVRAKLKEEQKFRSSLEEIHLKACIDSSEAKSEACRMKSEIEPLKQQLVKEKERNFQLATQVSDERRFKGREEQRAAHLEKQLEQKEEKLKTREGENTKLLRDNSSFKDEIVFLKDQVRNRESEVKELKTKVQDMQISVEEFIQSSRAATRLESQRWRQLTELAHGIQALGKEAMNANGCAT